MNIKNANAFFVQVLGYQWTMQMFGRTWTFPRVDHLSVLGSLKDDTMGDGGGEFCNFKTNLIMYQRCCPQQCEHHNTNNVSLEQTPRPHCPLLDHTRGRDS